MQTLKEVFLIKEGEIVLKGLNKSNFENMLIKNIKIALNNLSFKITSSQSTILIEPETKNDLQLIEKKIAKVFGISRYCKAVMCEKSIDSIQKIAATYLKQKLENSQTFKVTTKRSDKKFELNSQQISQKLGEFLLNQFPHLKVDLSENCNTTVYVEIRSYGAYIYYENLIGAGGLPVKCSDEGLLLISGGIDSPVAGWLMARRGVKLHAIHFHSPPYTSERALHKVEQLIEILAKWTGKINFFCINFTQIQETINQKCDKTLSTIINRRIMNKIAEQIALIQNKQHNCKIRCLINGESLGQVASQTLAAIECTKNSVDMPILQPLIGFDKIDIVKLARKIETFETSILPFEDCCTVFVPPHPKTKPTIADVLKNENKIENLNRLIETSISTASFKTIG